MSCCSYKVVPEMCNSKSSTHPNVLACCLFFICVEWSIARQLQRLRISLPTTTNLHFSRKYCVWLSSLTDSTYKVIKIIVWLIFFHTSSSSSSTALFFFLFIFRYFHEKEEHNKAQAISILLKRVDECVLRFSSWNLTFEWVWEVRFTYNRQREEK